jgi:nitrous oxide reductase accessory protein NosL
MKQLLMAVLLLLAAPAACQTVTKDASGNYIAVKRAETATKTGNTYTDAKGVKYEVYKSAKGKLFYYRTSKAGNVYKSYLIQTKN